MNQTLLVDPNAIDFELIDRAAKIIHAGGIVAFPTETVYGLGAKSTDLQSIRRVFEAKGRPSNHPLIVHVADLEMAKTVAANWSSKWDPLVRAWWPGPLTLVVERSPHTPAEVAGGRESVAIRMPAHPVALALIQAVGVPLVAPSANRFTEVSPTTATHVREGLGDRVDLILDGGKCSVGIESTVLSMLTEPPKILRPGMVARSQLARFFPAVDYAKTESATSHSPGTHHKHYSPKTSVFLSDTPTVVPPEAGWIGFEEAKLVLEVNSRILPKDPVAYAGVLYEVLHDLDGQNVSAIFIQEPPKTEEWKAIWDRLHRAAHS